MPTQTKAQVVVVTGASGWIARAIAHAFAKRVVVPTDVAMTTVFARFQDTDAAGYKRTREVTTYRGAKFAIRGFTDSIRAELPADPSRVHITMVQLPGVNATQFNWGRSKRPKQLAAAIAATTTAASRLCRR